MTFVCPPYVETMTHVAGDTEWVGVRARGAEWSWFTPAEAAALGRYWADTYANTLNPAKGVHAENTTTLPLRPPAPSARPERDTDPLGTRAAHATA